MIFALGITLAGPVVARAQTAPAGVPCTVQTNWICPGTPLATPCYIIDSGRAGPVVMVVSGIHGDEEGYAAAGQIRAWTVRRGKLIVLPQANQPAVLQHSHTQPGDTNAATRDLNRNFPTNRTIQVTMAGTPAMLAGRYGQGRVLCSSPHPEAMPDLDESFRRMIRWAAGK